MKNAGTLKVQIIKPLDDVTWDEAGPRLRTLRAGLAPALNATQRQFWPDLQEALELFRDGGKKNANKKIASVSAAVEKVLRELWSSEMVRYAQFLQSKGSDVDPRSHTPCLEYASASTRDLILSRWTGAHLRDLLAGRSSVPSWKVGAPFYFRSRACSLSGPSRKAILSLPLWGAGRKATRFAVSVCGSGDRATWDRMIDPDLEGRRAELVRRRKMVEMDVRKARKAKENVSRLQAEAARISREIEKLQAFKVGHVGVKYDPRKRKWYALISWTQEVPDLPESRGQIAVTNFGVNVFIQALAEDGSSFREDGRQILAVRRRNAARRRSLQASLGSMGSGSRGRGRKRKFAPLDRLSDKEARWTEKYGEQVAARLVSWCVRHGIGTLYVEDLAGIREGFEKETEGEADANVRRMIHSWPFYKLNQSLVRAGRKAGVAVEVKSAFYVSQECPDCHNVDPDNVRIVRYKGDPKMVDDVPHYPEEIRNKFKCTKCKLGADGDMVACDNHLQQLGRRSVIRRFQNEKWKEVRGKVTDSRDSASVAAE